MSAEIRKLFMKNYDFSHQTSDDYTLMLDDVPAEANLSCVRPVTSA